MSYQEKIKSLYEEQLKVWELFSNNKNRLLSAKIKTFHFDGFNINIQFNPERIISSSAKTDSKTIEKRPCFLCSKNRPKEQNMILWNNKYEMLVNPFPIFKEHFTIASLLHEKQQIKTVFNDFLSLSKDLYKYVIFYNGANCGASAPDHLHFQVGNRDFLPIEKDWKNYYSKYGDVVINSKNITITAIDDKLRRYLVLESNDKEVIKNYFEKIHSFYNHKNGEQEPMLNLLSYFVNEKYRVFIFIREKHRPYQFFEDGDKKILLSPASVDMGGVMITPREKDFISLTKHDIESIYNQVTISKEKLYKLIDSVLK